MIKQHLLNHITDRDVDDIMEIAAFGGITYWAIQPTLEEFAGLPEGKVHTVVEGEDACPFFGGEREVEKVHYLSRDEVRVAFGKLLDPFQTYVNDELHGYVLDAWRDRTGDGIAAEHIDAGAADVVVQVALFGKVVYS
ncbi:hypothetical protein NX794_07730 [Streptomyces sp. LP11]|uniref:Uncharacterized protein n=1 Tax=Streptomyces pyxinicus TaxID=2970331 RepID=A0ABT2AY03_9ACTN|nr:hypothetical protein [Streptomyces sp. LP11]MCS0601120.1 hypothetical protein [Streptomyces sp. LP11]